jgi:hypothetical protein
LISGDRKMKAFGWTTWERYLPSAKVQTRTGAASICMKPWDQILPEEGVAEKMADAKTLWRTWERYLPSEAAEAAHLLAGLNLERPERALI